MKQELIHVFRHQIGGIDQECVNARDLHSFLEVGKRFASWITQRIEECGYREGLDYIIFSQNWEKINDQEKQAVRNGRGRPSKEYYITLDMAKELCMIERNPKGRIARRYFIRMEKEARVGERVQHALVALSNTTLPMDTVTKALFFRAYGLTQEETARALDISKDRLQGIERRLREAGITIPSVHHGHRMKAFRLGLPRLLGDLIWKDREMDPARILPEKKEALPC